MLSPGAFNALLKTLEEPPSYVIFILATTEVHKLPITILSRCQRYDFKRITIDTITARMQQLTEAEQVQVEEKALRYIAKAADGSMRDALSLLDQCIAFNLGDGLTYDKVLDVLGAVDTEVFSRLLRCVLEQNVLGCVQLLEEIVMQGRELSQFVTDFTWYLRNLMLVQSSDNLEDVIDMSSDNLARLKKEAAMVDLSRIIRYIRIFSELSGQIRYASQKRILVEIALIKLCRPSMETTQDALLERIRDVEDKVENGVTVVPAQYAPDQTGTGAPTTGGGVRPKLQLPQAIPDDVREVVSHWAAIVGSAENPMRIYLKEAIPSLGGDNHLMLVLQDGVASDYFTQHPQNKEQLENLIAGYANKEIEINIQVTGTRQEAEENYFDLRQGIPGVNMEIEEEEWIGNRLNLNRRSEPMAKRGGYPGGMMPGNMNNLMKQAQRMQRQMEEGQKELETKEFTASAGGGAVEVTVSGKKEVLRVKLTEEVLDPEDIEMLQDLIIAATNEALKQADEANEALMGKMTGGLGGFPF